MGQQNDIRATFLKILWSSQSANRYSLVISLIIFIQIRPPVAARSLIRRHFFPRIFHGLLSFFIIDNRQYNNTRSPYHSRYVYFFSFSFYRYRAGAECTSNPGGAIQNLTGPPHKIPQKFPDKMNQNDFRFRRV